MEKKESFLIKLGVAILIFGLTVGWIYSQSPKTSPTKQISPTPAPTQLPITPTPQNQLGIIEGSLSYPGEGIPPDLQVCAENQNNKQIYCTQQHIQGNTEEYINGIGYKIELPAGNYLVYATIPDNPEYKAYYSEFVACGLNSECNSHEPIVVEVKPGETIKQIDPGDWYAPPTTPTPQPPEEESTSSAEVKE